jgi:3-hydroxy-9,10-secoandrosta-1,3,5(10)-triene-9,17-dione monooxygenase
VTLIGARLSTTPGLGSAEYLVGRPDFVVDQGSWHVTGLGGTGSKDVLIEGAFVPKDRTHW